MFNLEELFIRIESFTKKQFPINNLLLKTKISLVLDNDQKEAILKTEGSVLKALLKTEGSVLKALLRVLYVRDTLPFEEFPLSSMALSEIANKIKALYLIFDIANHLDQEDIRTEEKENFKNALKVLLTNMAEKANA